MKPARVPEEEQYDPPPAAKIFCGLIYVMDLNLAEVLHSMEQAWGPVEFISRRHAFADTRSYGMEMGSPLARKFVSFREEVAQEDLPRLKWEAKRLEGGYLNARGGRRVNIDPGLTKPFAHRPYLARGIYADLTLVYRKKSYRPLEWTYPDYGTPGTVRMMNNLRKHCFLQKRAIEKGRIE